MNPQSLHAIKGDTVKETIEQRRNYLSQWCSFGLKATGIYSFDPDIVATKHCENLIGAVHIPLGIAGPLKITFENGREENLYIPMATTEGALIASTNRGCATVSNVPSGVHTHLHERTMTRGPVLTAEHSATIYRAAKWIKENYEAIRHRAEEGSRFCRLLSVKQWIVGRNLFLRFSYQTGDAMGMNMATFATEQALECIIQNNEGLRVVALSGNVCSDKKPCGMNFIEGRGAVVQADIVLPQKLVRDKLHTTVKAFVDTQYRKNLLGSSVAQSLGYNAHYANIVAAIFLATGQDPAQVVEGSLGITTAEETDDGDLYFSVYLPNLDVGTVGGGTELATQKEALQIMGIDGTLPPGENSIRFAQIIAGAILAGELSLLASLAEGTLGKAHKTLGR